MRSMDRVQLILAVTMEVLLAVDIVNAIVTQKVSVSSFVCIAIIAMLKIGEDLIATYKSRKNKEK